ncbi:hypothetical protein SteCoe_14517 [Stentor coeruleus]|uniref:C2H2-type domain-containing protein n=1 Tax=Stentor coeruleus TaxID=5963 RepID=A0A1R2C5S8_9CILI|nr:hypothetical protein SteCoe_14517 [Stentor coeruleus]
MDFISLKCKTCDNKPIRQCNSCLKCYLCDNCTQLHIKCHEEQESECIFGKIRIKLPEDKIKQLKNSIKKTIETIEKYKKEIITEGLKALNQIQNKMRSSFEYLDMMIADYNKLIGLKIFEEKDYIRAEEIIKTDLVFDYPMLLDAEVDFIKVHKIQKPQCKSQKFNKTYTLQGHTGIVKSISFSNDDHYLVSGSSDKTIVVWDLIEKRQEAIFIGHTDQVLSVTITYDNQLIISGSDDKTVRVWNLNSKCQDMIFEGFRSSVNTVAVTHDNKFVISGSTDKSIKVWNLIEKNLEYEFKGHTSNVNRIIITADDQYVISGSSDNSIILWNMLGKYQEDIIEYHPSGVNFISMIYNNQCLSICDNKFIVWSLDEKKLILELPFYSAFALSQDEKTLITCSDNRTILQVWDIKEKYIQGELQGHLKEIKCVTISKDNQFAVTGSSDSTVKVWNLSSRQQIANFKGHLKEVRTVVITNDNQFVISGSEDLTIKVWNLQSKILEKEFTGHANFINAIAISSDNKFIVSGSSDKTIKVWNLYEKQKEINLLGHNDTVVCIAISNDNQYIVTGSREKTIRVWNLSKKKIIRALKGYFSSILNISIASDNRTIVFSTEDKSVRIWKIGGGRSEQIICNLDNFKSRSFLNTAENKVYFTNGIGLVQLNLGTNELKQKMILHPEIEKIFKDNHHLYPQLLPKASIIA